MGMDVSGPVNDISKYSFMRVTPNNNGIQYAPNPKDSKHQINFPYGSSLTVEVINRDGIVHLHVSMFLGAGYPSSGGLCKKPRNPSSPDNMLMGSDGKSYHPANKNEIAAFANS
ncbi:hypothetical protein BASA50_008911 [Batrachochytrium salamandrivorans]|uniref:Plastocyanin-like domain-containing protein n=1 Tax=Batrachochytrium salamandrivorans TaxID=1357716 RepID=A0ABQ8F5D8_9FUNG|nr:hypothetical protein BASA50_008911 [Batrachochytrium salamandrivorans]KAH6599017.1 hypothetical protein BASA61_002721 [Batrachochytrium salamandrivorans]